MHLGAPLRWAGGELGCKELANHKMQLCLSYIKAFIRWEAFE